MTRETPKFAKRVALAIAIPVVALAIFVGGRYAYNEWSGNIHVVDAGRVYRSAQLSGPEFDHVISTYGIRSILNLRGSNPGESWYDDEMVVSKDRSVEHYDYGISANRPVSVSQMHDILQIIQLAPKPVLLHCMGGADRAGLASALYRFSQGVGASEASQELCLWYGHFPYMWSRTNAMDESFNAYAGQYKTSERRAESL